MHMIVVSLWLSETERVQVAALRTNSVGGPSELLNKQEVPVSCFPIAPQCR